MAAIGRCVCGERAVQLHHVVFEAELRRRKLPLRDAENLLPLCWTCHNVLVHSRRSFPLTSLRDENFEYAVEKMGPGPAYNYLMRYYAGDDPRLDRILDAC